MTNYDRIQNELNDEINNLLKDLQKSYNLNLMPPERRAQLINIETGKLLKNKRVSALEQLSKLTGRKTICYFSPFLQSFSGNPEISINDNDINGLSEILSNVDKKTGLDLIIHTPGGSTAATEAIGEYLRNIFKCDIRVIVPNMAMSGGTMLACSGKEILMFESSSLGPFDPQYKGSPAQGVIEEFEEAIQDVETNPNRSLIWREIISKYPPSFLSQCRKSVECSEKIVRKWLKNMFPEKKDDKKIRKIVKELCSFNRTKMHDRHYNFVKCSKLGLKVQLIQNETELFKLIHNIYDLYLFSVYYEISTLKYIESSDKNSFIMYGKR